MSFSELRPSWTGEQDRTTIGIGHITQGTQSWLRIHAKTVGCSRGTGGPLDNRITGEQANPRSDPSGRRH